MAVQKALEYRKKQDVSVPDQIKDLRLDILNVPSHRLANMDIVKRGATFAIKLPKMYLQKKILYLFS